MGHSFNHRYCITTSYKGTSICSLPGFSLMMDFFALLWSKDGHFRRDKERWRHNVDCKSLGLAIPKRGVSFLCDKYWRRYTVWHSLQCTCSISHLMSVHGRSFFLVPILYVNLLFFFMEVPLSMLDPISMHPATDGCWSLWYSHFTFRSTFEHVLSIWFQTSVWRFPYLIMEDWIPKIIEKRWRLFTPDFLSNM